MHSDVYVLYHVSILDCSFVLLLIIIILRCDPHVKYLYREGG